MSIFDTLRGVNYEDLISGGAHERLQNIEIIDSYGTSTRAKGWNTYRDANGHEVQIPEDINSSVTPFEPLILLVPPEKIGTHEATDPAWIPGPDEDQRGFANLSFDGGWHGSAIAVAAYGRCQGQEVDNKIYQQIYNALKKKGGIGILPDLEYGDLGVLDGHHRRMMAANGPIPLKYVPVQLIPYMSDPSVVLDTWHNDGRVWSPKEVFACFKEPGRVADAKRTKFGVIGSDGITRRILDTQPEVHIPLRNLL